MNVSGADVGILTFVGSNGNHINGNTANNNLVGISVCCADSLNNKLNGNTALGNLTIDLFDNNVNCDNNKWTGNVFSTRNQNCIN